MPDYKKTLILAEVVVTEEDAEEQEEEDNYGDTRVDGEEDVHVSSSRADDSIIGLTKEKKKKKRKIRVNELAVSTEHAPFRHRSAKKGAVDIGSQRKKQKTSA